MRHIAASARGFVYCVARKGVTGLHTTFSADLDAYLARCRTATKLPLALGFGVQDAADVNFLRGKVDIAVVGSATLRLIDDKGVAAVGAFVRGLR
jgi:tryptophan synthase alpha chain